MKKDITNRADIELLINTFYDQVKNNATIGHFFSDKKVNWEHHLPIMYNFWENILFYTGQYNGNPMAVHKQLNQEFPLSKTDFAEWIRLFKATADQLFAGDNTELIKQRAQSIALVMELKIIHGNNTSSIT
jgi:hemoglobin